ALRQEFELYANVRPVKSIVPGGRYQNVDLVIVRENTEGLYVGMDRTFKVGGDPKALAQATSVMTRDGCRRIVRYAFEYAKRHGRKKVTVVHKANILKATSGLFLETAQMMAAAMMVDHIGELEAGNRLRRALETVIVKDNVRTKDLGGSASTSEFARAVARRL